MDDKPTKRGGGAVVSVALVAVLIVLPLLYVLSIGPAFLLVNSGVISPKYLPVLEVIYRPLAVIKDKVPVIGPAIDQYANLWR